jgi:hypothetical protein
VTQAQNQRGDKYDDIGVIVRQTMGDQTNCHPDYQISTGERYREGKQTWATVKMDSCVHVQERARAFALNTACLAKMGACRTSKEMLPQVF